MATKQKRKKTKKTEPHGFKRNPQTGRFEKFTINAEDPVQEIAPVDTEDDKPKRFYMIAWVLIVIAGLSFIAQFIYLQFIVEDLHAINNTWSIKWAIVTIGITCSAFLPWHRLD